MPDDLRQSSDAKAASDGAFPAAGQSRVAAQLRRIAGAENHEQGKAAGIERDEHWHVAEQQLPVVVTCIDYSPDKVQIQDVTAEMTNFLARHRPPWSVVRWINIDGLANPAILQAFAEKYDLHPLALEDVVHIPQRPKVEDYPGGTEHHPRLFIVARMLRLIDGRLSSQQISMFVGRNTLLTFTGNARRRLGSATAKNQYRGLAHADQRRQFPALYAAGCRRRPVLPDPGALLRSVGRPGRAGAARTGVQHARTGSHNQARTAVAAAQAWPMRDAIHALQREPHECLSDTTRTYLRDVYDHTIQIIDLVETYREFSASLTETYMSSISQRMNEIMKVLTIMGTIFIPLTFLAGVYGMNMRIPEAQYSWMYPAFWVICIATAAGMLLWFKRRGWM